MNTITQDPLDRNLPIIKEPPKHIEQRRRFFSDLVDVALDADLRPWPLAETALAAIASEWR